MVKKHFLGLAAVALGVVGFTTPSQALVYDLTCTVNASITCGQPSYGRLTVQDNAADSNKVDLLVDLNPLGSAGGEKVLDLFLNYDDAKFSSSTAFSVNGGTVSYSIAENNQKAGGFSGGKFDIELPATGNLGFEPVMLTIALAGIDLNPTDFNFMDTSGTLYNAVHIGNCGTDVPNCPAGQSIFVGANTLSTGGGPDPRDVPEPASMLLLGVGLLGLGLTRRRVL